MSWLFQGFHRRRVQEAIKNELADWKLSINTGTRAEHKVLEKITRKTAELNRNNVTRTMAYYFFYLQHPEVHWALLAHMVSRNTGWNMTDLKGEWLPRLLNRSERHQYFLFMERSNWLIFQDAYPQLLLYEESKKLNKNLFHLLPHLHVSRFMQVMWYDFWKNKNSERITLSLIINEQNYIEKRVVQQEKFGAPIFGDIKYFIQDALDMCMILFPCHDQGRIRLYGKQVSSFPEIGERIKLGKVLYSLLFSPGVLSGVLEWCEKTYHTGSRENYDSVMFSSKRMGSLQKKYKQRLEKGKHRKGAEPIFSPKLMDVWPDHEHAPATHEDWYRDPTIAEELAPEKAKVRTVDKAYRGMLERLESAIIAKEILLAPR